MIHGTILRIKRKPDSHQFRFRYIAEQFPEGIYRINSMPIRPLSGVSAMCTVGVFFLFTGVYSIPDITTRRMPKEWFYSMEQGETPSPVYRFVQHSFQMSVVYVQCLL